MRVRKLRLCLLLGLLACDETEPDFTRERGEIGRGKFIYECLGSSDTACATGEASFPQAVAKNARFALRFAITEGIQPTVIGATPTFVQTIVGGFRALHVGDLAFLAVNGNREVIDIKHVRAAPIAEMRVRRDNALPERELHLSTGQSVELRAAPVDTLGVELAGALDYEWTSGNPELVRVETFVDVNRIRVRALGPGETTLNVMAGGEGLSLLVRVSGEAQDSDSGVPEDDASTGDAGMTPDTSDGDAGIEGDASQESGEST